MEKPDQLRELFRMQKALNERIGVKTEGMSDEEKTKWLLNYCRAMSQEIAELTDSDGASLSPDGQLAYLLGTNAVTITGPEGQPVTTRGRAVTVWRREADGNWRCAVDIWNDEPAER